MALKALHLYPHYLRLLVEPEPAVDFVAIPEANGLPQVVLVRSPLSGYDLAVNQARFSGRWKVTTVSTRKLNRGANDVTGSD